MQTNKDFNEVESKRISNLPSRCEWPYGGKFIEEDRIIISQELSLLHALHSP